MQSFRPIEALEDRVLLSASPQAVDDSYQVTHDQALIVSAAAGVLANDIDPDGDALISIVDDSSNINGSLTLNLDGSFNYTPTAGFVGSASFSYFVDDGSGYDIGNVTINVTNSDPVAGDDSYTISHDTTLNVPADGVLANDSDADGDPLLLVLGDDYNANGSVTLNPDGSFSYTPNAGFLGTGTFTYFIDDGGWL